MHYSVPMHCRIPKLFVLAFVQLPTTLNFTPPISGNITKYIVKLSREEYDGRNVADFGGSRKTLEHCCKKLVVRKLKKAFLSIFPLPSD